MDDSLKILVVDDEEKIRSGCQRILAGAGYQTAAAENGQVALDILTSENVDVMLLDLRMPVMEGEAVLEQASEKYPNLPVIIITGHGTVDTAVDCMKKGAYDFVTKPFKMNQFLLTVNRAAENRRLQLKARRAEEENIRNLYDLHLEKSRIKTIINCLANGVVVTNRNLEVVLCNSAWSRLMNIQGAVETPAPFEKFADSPPLVETLNKILGSVYNPEEAVSQEVQTNGKFLRAISAAAPGPENSAAGTVTVLEDITAFKQLDKMKSDFIDMVAHELRTPLFSVRQLLNVQLDGLCGEIQEKQQDFLQRSVRQIDNLQVLIKDLLDISKAESGVLIQRHVPVELSEIIDHAVEAVGPHASQHGIDIVALTDQSPTVRADPKSMEEVFINLLANAVNYSPGGGRTMVEICDLGDYVEIKVTDQGIGIAPEEAGKIFDKFYRVKHPKTRAVVGTGLGLSLVKSIVEAHRGTIEVESRIDEGTCFKILLPTMK